VHQLTRRWSACPPPPPCLVDTPLELRSFNVGHGSEATTQRSRGSQRHSRSATAGATGGGGEGGDDPPRKIVGAGEGGGDGSDTAGSAKARRRWDAVAAAAARAEFDALVAQRREALPDRSILGAVAGQLKPVAAVR
jgi:hypothetical protein